MIKPKTKEQIEIMREGGRHLAEVLEKVSKKVRAGVSSLELDRYAKEIIEGFGDRPSFLDYQPAGAMFPYPYSTCLSVNDEIVHGLPKQEKILREGDLIGIDIGLIHKGLFLDSAITVPVGKIDKKAMEIIDVTKQALEVGISEAKIGKTVGDIGFAIENYIKEFGYSLVRELAGHGVGFAVHEEPFVPNFGKKGKGAKLSEGLVIAIEPMVNEGKAGIVLDSDGQTYKTKDGGRSAHFEHTVAITKEGPIILTEK